MKTLKELLIEFNACGPAIEWAGDKTIEQVVNKCHRGDWLLYLAEKIELHERKIISCAGHCANTVRHLMKDKRSVDLVDLCMNFEDESISFEELEVARAAARAAYARAYDDDYANAYVTAAAYAAYAADRDAAADAADAATRDFADAAARAAANRAFADTARALYAAAYNDTRPRAHARATAAYKDNQLQTANIVRERIGQDIINKVNLLLNN